MYYLHHHPLILFIRWAIELRAEAASTSHLLPLPPPIILSHTRLDAPSSGTPPLHLLSTNRRADRPEETGDNYRDAGGRPQETGVIHRGIETVEETSNSDDRVMINQGVTTALVARDADRNTNGNDSHISGARRMFPKESDKIEKYVGGLPDMIHGSIVASKPKIINVSNVECQLRETVKNQFTHSQKPKVDKKDFGYGFTVKSCFVCGRLNHLIRDCDFHEKRMARKAELNNGWNRKSSQREIRQTWNNVQRVNKQNQFFPSAVLTRTGKIPVNTARASGTKNVSTARQSFNRQAVLTSTAMKVNTVKPIVNRVRPANVNVVSTVGGKGKLLLSPQQVVIGDRKDTTGTISPNTMVDPVLEIDYPHRALKNKGIVDSGCSRHMTGNKAYLAEYQDFNGGPVAFGGSKGYITGKGPQEANHNAGTEDIIDAGDSEKEDESAQDCFREGLREEEQVFLDELERLKRQEKDANKAAEVLKKDTPAKASSTNLVNTVSTSVSTACLIMDYLSLIQHSEQDDSEIPPLEDIYQNFTDGIFTHSSYDDEGAVADFTNLETVVNVSPIPTSRIISSHPSALILGDPTSAVQTRSKVNKSSGAHAFVSYVQKQRRNNHKDFQHCLFACFLSQNEPKKISEALEDESWVDAMQEELLQFKI
ncbi:putative ribonuclease H-like domain-containing protein [Tanacetum coccineum]